MTRVALRRPGGGRGIFEGVCGGSDFWQGEGENNASAGPYPEEILADEKCCDPQASRLVLADDSIGTCRQEKMNKSLYYGVLLYGT